LPRDTLRDGACGELPLTEEIRLVLTNVFPAELVRRALEVACEIFDCVDVTATAFRHFDLRASIFLGIRSQLPLDVIFGNRVRGAREVEWRDRNGASSRTVIKEEKDNAKGQLEASDEKTRELYPRPSSREGRSRIKTGLPIPDVSGAKGARMSTVHLHQRTTLTPEQYIAGLTDFGPGRSKLFGNSADEYLKVHSQNRTQADVTEGSGGIWERLHYDWSDPNHVVLTKPLSTSEHLISNSEQPMRTTRPCRDGRGKWNNHMGIPVLAD
jgi:hypothetical protein